MGSSIRNQKFIENVVSLDGNNKLIHHKVGLSPAATKSNVVVVVLQSNKKMKRKNHKTADSKNATNTINSSMDRFCFSSSSISISISSCWLFLITILLFVGVFAVDVAQAHNQQKQTTNLKDSKADTKEYNSAHDFFRSVHEFSNHAVIKPELHHGRHKRSIRSTLDAESGLHVPHITLSYHHQGQRITADLHLNERLIPDGHFLRYQDTTHGNGDIVQNFTKTDIDLCHYQGVIRGKPESKVAISTCNGGVNGVVHDGMDTYFIHSGADGRIQDDHFIFKHADILHNATCGYNTESNHIHETNERPRDWDNIQNRIDGSEFNRILRYKRSNSIDNNIIRGPFNANKHSSFVELVIVVDNKVYKSLGESMKKVHKHCKDLANIVNALYEPLNIFIALVGVVVWNESNEIEFSQDGDVTLKNFLHYRRTKLAVNHPNDNAQLLTKEPFNGGVVGKALKGPICTYEYSGGVSMEHSQIVAVVAATMAHEMGHNFGMEHDTPDCRCPDEKCIMSASSTSVVPRHWSSCSIDQLNVAFSRGMNYCLRNKPTKLFDSPQCGNGFVEPGEQCDCGLAEYCKNTCCDPNTCMLRQNASCATGECCDLSTCRPKTAGTNCRPSENECDLSEYCTGESEYCPTNVFKRDTDTCDGGNAYCYQGTCRSRSNQCRILWGPSGESSEHCYWKNLNGSRHGNCGFDRINNKYFQCEREDIYCGMLHCRHLNERLEFGMESVAVLSHSFLNHEGNIIPCRTAIVDLGLQSTDPGLTPNGAKCGENKMCVGQKCIGIDNLRASGFGVECPENCNGNGICNSKGHCHCNLGYAPPFCSGPGPGGSRDSGPATNPNSRDGFTRFMFIFFLGVVPVMALLCFLLYYCRNNPQMPGKLFENIMKSTTKGSAPRGPPSAPNGGLPKSTPSSTDDMNSALLKSPSDSDATINNGMFGKFKGFTLRPLSDSGPPTAVVAPNVAFVHPVSKSTAVHESSNGGVPARSAPPVPKHATLDRNDMQKPNGVVLGMKKASTLGKLPDASAPALPPPNPGSHPRPIISNPVLETSTCKEIGISGKGNEAVPVRPAPTAPLALNPAPPPPVPLHTDPKLNTRPKDGTIKRIASFLKKEDKYVPKIKPVIDKEKLKNIEISAPIPQTDTSNSDSEQQDETKNLVKRAQSMRSPTKKQPLVQTFGSMRNPPGLNRPKSVIGTARPKSPPPRPPAPPGVKKTPSTTSSGYQLPLSSKVDHTYDDCEAIEEPLSDIKESPSPTGSDNIYSVIDEIVSPVKVPSSIEESSDSMGLLGEIVNEIEKRNVDSIYSASTLKSASSAEGIKSNAPYENVPSGEHETEPDYIKSSSSTASGGYIRPSTVSSAPIARVAPTRSDTSISTTNAFSSFKPKAESESTTTGRTGRAPTITPKPSTIASRGGNKSFSKSPSPLAKTTTVDSKSTTDTTASKKSLPSSGAAKPKPLTKPTVAGAGTKSTVGRTISTNSKKAIESTTATATKPPQSNTAQRPTAGGKVSTVASLQQKFENSPKTKPLTGSLAKK
ncbi:disintegrin and metalloproteinase domain-containing protein 12 isoform X2 [Episyrphus balteatus]|uniref:disintegrin and metalloproteinase domain-containing protein 12 isoform X2 n=1 Tax=Episyrphus balteatus TaxID=286459 RepID=UPI00248663D9|nr:disintegrin and metalloproteinase domain-containing protein 12 isoform X2 [Episyrphus balteatus]